MSSYSLRVKIMRDVNSLKDFLPPNKLKEIERICLKSIFDIDEFGNLISSFMNEVEPIQTVYVHGLLLCQENPTSFILDSFLQGSILEYREFCGISKSPFILKEDYFTTTRERNIPVYRTDLTYDEFHKSYLIEEFKNDQIELNTPEISFYLPNEMMNDKVEEPGYHKSLFLEREYLNLLLEKYLKEKEKRNFSEFLDETLKKIRK